jgi:hypothetical protein
MAGIDDFQQSSSRSEAYPTANTPDTRFNDQLTTFIEDMTTRLGDESHAQQLGLFVKDMTSRLNSGSLNAKLGLFIQDITERLDQGKPVSLDEDLQYVSNPSSFSQSESTVAPEASAKANTTSSPSTSDKQSSDAALDTPVQSANAVNAPFSVDDTNGNNIFDADDVVDVRYDNDKISDAIAARSERIILMGEDHRDLPTDTLESSIKKMIDQGKPVIYTIEASAEYLSANGPDLIAQLNNGKITIEEFENRFASRLKEAYGADLAINADELSEQIVRMHAAGAKIVPIDDGALDVINASKMVDDISKVSHINRDEIMAENIINLYNENPEATIISSIGGAHTQTNVNIQNDFGSSDSENPVGTRLLEAIGRDNIFSIYNYMTQGTDFNEYFEMLSDGYLTGEYQQVRSDTWDLIVPANGE